MNGRCIRVRVVEGGLVEGWGAFVASHVTEMVFARDVVGWIATSALACLRSAFVRRIDSVSWFEVLQYVVVAGVRVGKRREAHSHDLDEEEDEDGHQGDAFYPVVLGYRSGEAWIRERVVGRGEKL